MLPVLGAHFAPPPSGPGGRSWLPLHSQHFLSGGPSVDRGAGRCGLGWADSRRHCLPGRPSLHLSKAQRPAWSEPPGPCPRGPPQAKWGSRAWWLPRKGQAWGNVPLHRTRDRPGEGWPPGGGARGLATDLPSCLQTSTSVKTKWSPPATHPRTARTPRVASSVSALTPTCPARTAGPVWVRPRLLCQLGVSV